MKNLLKLVKGVLSP